MKSRSGHSGSLTARTLLQSILQHQEQEVAGQGFSPYPETESSGKRKKLDKSIP